MDCDGQSLAFTRKILVTTACDPCGCQQITEAVVPGIECWVRLCRDCYGEAGEEAGKDGGGEEPHFDLGLWGLVGLAEFESGCLGNMDGWISGLRGYYI